MPLTFKQLQGANDRLGARVSELDAENERLGALVEADKDLIRHNEEEIDHLREALTKIASQIESLPCSGTALTISTIALEALGQTD